MRRTVEFPSATLIVSFIWVFILE